MTTLDLDEIQGLILRGYRMDFACHLVLEIVEPDRFRTLLADLTDENLESPYITVAANWETKPPEGEPATHCVNLGFTFAGLKMLVPDVESLKFPEAFRQGAAARGEKEAGEMGGNHPDHWKPTLLGDDVHAILSVYARDADELETVLSYLRGQMRGAATELDRFPANRLDGEDVEHFGFRDGLSQPTIEGLEPRVGLDDPFERVPAGEFVLGQTPQRADPWEEVPAEYGINGSFSAFRVMSQDVQAFNKFLTDEAARTGLGANLLAAKMCGRWRNGDPLVLRPTSGSPEVPEDDRNMFDYESSNGSPNGDRDGLRCPRGAHIRRAFPRSQRVIDDFDGFQRRIIRRGMPYGPKFDSRNPTDEPRGLVGHFICASLANQYEYIMRRWINDGLFTGGRLGRTKDPVTGANDPAHSRFSIPGEEDVELTGFTQYVTTRGCVYLFLPSMTALRQMATQADPRTQAA
jgi:deferrochelatase/peroxidase EfeB